jgi:hypothetical protein
MHPGSSSGNAAYASPYRVAGSDVEQMVKLLRVVPVMLKSAKAMWKVEEKRRGGKGREGKGRGEVIN